MRDCGQRTDLLVTGIVLQSSLAFFAVWLWHRFETQSDELSIYEEDATRLRMSLLIACVGLQCVTCMALQISDNEVSDVILVIFYIGLYAAFAALPPLVALERLEVCFAGSQYQVKDYTLNMFYATIAVITIVWLTCCIIFFFDLFGAVGQMTADILFFADAVAGAVLFAVMTHIFLKRLKHLVANRQSLEFSNSASASRRHVIPKTETQIALKDHAQDDSYEDIGDDSSAAGDDNNISASGELSKDFASMTSLMAPEDVVNRHTRLGSIGSMRQQSIRYI